MAGRGSRLRPHTLSVPKPLVKIAGKPMVQWLVEGLSASCAPGSVEEIVFIIGDFGKAVEEELLAIAKKLGTTGRITHQDKPLGTAHAILCAGDSLQGPCVVAFSDTLFKADFKFGTERDGIIWAKRVEDPSAFGVLKINEDNVITDFVEKPTEFVSDLAIVGIYYFKETEKLRAEMQYLIDNDLREKGEYQLTNAMENMKAKGAQFEPAEIEEWLDCGNKNAVVYTNNRLLNIHMTDGVFGKNLSNTNSHIIQPCKIGDDVVLENAIIGPNVSIADGASISNSIVRNSIVGASAIVVDAVFDNAMLGANAKYKGKPADVSLGDFSEG